MNTENKNTTETETKDQPQKLSYKTVIVILSVIIFLLLFYIIASRFIEKRNIELSESYLALTSEYFSEEITTAEIYVNINSDSIFELTQLEGIGKSKAEAIIEYRKENGDFVSIEEIKNVNGIGDSVYEKIKDQIYVELP